MMLIVCDFGLRCAPLEAVREVAGQLLSSVRIVARAGKF